MKTDIEIAQESTLEPIIDIAKKVGLYEDDIEMYGRYKAKLTEEALSKLEKRSDGKLILVTAINPTPAGEGRSEEPHV